MKVLESRTFVGPNPWAHFPVMQLVVDLGILEEWPSVRLDGFAERLVAALPSLRQHGCSYGEPGGFVRRLTEGDGTWLGHVLEHVAIELQNLAGATVTFGKTRGTGEPGRYNVVYEYEETRCGEQAGKLGLWLILSLLPVELRAQIPAALVELSFREELEDYIRLTQRRALGPSTMSLVRAAQERDIPWLRLNDQSLVQLGHGKYQKRIQATVTSETRHIAVQIASDKEETNRILGDIGLPVPHQRLVRTPEEAVRAAHTLGYPVVVKPLDANHGRGVAINLSDDAAVRVGFAEAREHARTIIVETYLSGDDHRMLVVNGELIAVAKRVPGHVRGDGRHTIAKLVDLVNADPNRGIGHEKILTRIELDHQAERLMAQAGVTVDTVLEEGRVLYLRSTGNLSTGGTAIDVTDLVHPDNRDMAVRAVAAIGLDVAGVDFLTLDIARSYKDIGGGICEINAAPGFRMHVAPTEGTPRDAAGPVMDMLFPPGTPSRIPIAAVTGTNGKTTTARMLAHIHKMAGRIVGLATTDGVYIDGRKQVEGDLTGPQAARMVLRDPTVDTAVLETARGGLLRAGMGYRKCNVGAVLNIAEDHLGLRGIDTLEQLAEVKRIVVEVAKDAAFLNADDPHCLSMADHTSAATIWYVTMSPVHDLVRAHIQAGGCAVVLEAGINGHMITMYQAGAQIPLLWTHLIPATLEGKALHNVQNAMFAAGMAFAMGVRLDDVRTGLRTFDTSFFQAPGRLNIYDQHPFRVILDYGHNPAAVRAMVQLSDALDVHARRIVVLGAPGDRRDQDIVNTAAEAAGHFDHYICHRDDRARGRGSDEVPTMLRDALLARGVAAEQIEVIPEEVAALDAALRQAEPGDLVLVFGDQITRCWKQIIRFRPDGQAPLEPRAARVEEARAEVSRFVGAPNTAGRAVVVDERGARLSRETDD